MLLVDDHPVVLAGLRRLLTGTPGFRVAGEAGTSAEAIALAQDARPDVVLLDVRLPDTSGIEACRTITSRDPEAKIIMLSAHGDDQYVIESMLAGASGYLMKHVDPARLIQAIREAVAGQATLDSRAAVAVVSRLRELSIRAEASELAKLSDHEKAVLALIAEGCTNGSIAQELHLSEKTARNHVSHLLRKLGLRSRAHAAAWAAERGVGQPPRSSGTRNATSAGS
ncbi:MAG: response regulator [Miltoncostaeaceae bacterium]